MPEQQEARRLLPQNDIERHSEEVTQMKSIDKEVLEGYDNGAEKNRLRTGIGLIEFERTKELLLSYLPEPPAVIYDIGGAYGEYSWWLASLGYEVHLFDLSEGNIRMAGELSGEYPGVSLAAREVCDARSVERADGSADAVLLMGPLYHIVEREERKKALLESKRLLKENGLLFTAAITPYATLLWATTVFGTANRLLEEDSFLSMVERELADGEHIRPKTGSYRGIGRSHFHRAEELREELSEAGFRDSRIHGVVGGAWLAPDLDALWENPRAREALMKTVRLLDGHEDIMGLSTHLLSVSKK